MIPAVTTLKSFPFCSTIPEINEKTSFMGRLYKFIKTDRESKKGLSCILIGVMAIAILDTTVAACKPKNIENYTSLLLTANLLAIVLSTAGVVTIMLQYREHQGQ